jgi:hypothetical protein
VKEEHAMRRLVSAAVITAALTAIVGLGFAQGTNAATPEKPLPRPAIYVESQGLCCESIVTAQDLPDHGPFQVLEPDPDDHCGFGLKTEFGPGDKGYVGGRWIVTMPDGTTARFMCPLLGPGFEPPQ